eukprot:c25173_g1_i1 orf=1121-8023(-)
MISKEQHTKVQQFSQQQNNEADVLQLERYAGPQLQPVRPQAMPKQRVGVEGQSYEARRVAEKRSNGPLPLIRLTHTSNWGDDERETLQERPQALMQSERVESGRPRNGYQFSDSWASDQRGPTDSGRPTSRNGSLSGYDRDSRDSQNHDRNGGFGFEVRSTRDMGLSNSMAKGIHSKQFDVDSREDITIWSRGPSRNDSLKREWSSPAKEFSYNRDARLGNSSRSFNSRNMGLEREMHTSAIRAVDFSYRGDNSGLDTSARELRSRDGSSRPDVYYSKHGVDDQQADRSRKSMGGHQFGRSNTFSAGRVHAGASKDLSGLDYGRDKRTSVLYGQDPFLEESKTSKSSPSFVFEALVGMSGLEPKIIKRKKDDSQNFRDPARELFEAELERVQRMQEQERQRLVEERERAIELARKEEEERERLAKEGELLRLKMEEEAREAAAQAQREEEEAARKAEEIRRAREEEKRMVVLEEERRKEAARRKLLELEQRIAQRESVQQQRGYSGREVSVGSFERARRMEDIVIQDEHRVLPSFDKSDSSELSRGPMLLESTMRLPADTRGGEGMSGDRSRVVQMKTRGTLDDGSGLPLTMNKHHLRDDIPRLEPELEHKGPNRSFLLGASKSSSLLHGPERVQAGPFARKEHWQTDHNERFSGGNSSMDINTDYMDPGIERENDGWWGRDNRRRFQEGQRLSSPPLPFYMNGGETEYPSYGRLRQSLPKQPRVPPPIFGRLNSHKQISQSETMPAVSSAHRSDDSEDLRKEDLCKHNVNSTSHETTSENSLEKADYDRLLIETSSIGKFVSTAPNEGFAPLHHPMTVSDETAEAEITIGSQTCKEISQPDEIDELSEQLSDLTESEEHLGVDEKQLAADMQLNRTAGSADEKDGWLVQTREQDMGEEMCVSELPNEEAVEVDSEDEEWESSKVFEDIGTTIEHGTQKEEVGEATWESQHTEDEGDGEIVDEPEGAADSQWGSNELYAPGTEKQDDTNVKALGLQDAVEDHVVQPPQNVLSSANGIDFVQVGQSEGHMHGQSLLQQFQQPFSFMAVPLSQSTTLNGVTSHPPMLPSMHSLQAQQELPYHLQMGLLPGTPLMPNAIQIGSIQMPLQVHPQMPPLAHVHQQPPVFQFGQLCPFSPPVPPMQPGVQIHHAMGQPLLAQHYQPEFLPTVEGSHLSKVDEMYKKSEDMAVQSSYGLSSDLNSSMDINSDSFMGSRLTSTEHIDQKSAVVSVSAAQTISPTAEVGRDAASFPGADISIEVNQDTSVGKITGSRRRNSSARSFGIYGRGRGRSHAGKNDVRKGPYSAAETWPETTTKDVVQIRTYRQVVRRAEYKIRKPLAASERDPEFSLDQGNHPSSYAKDVDASDRLKSTEMSLTEDTIESRSYTYSQSLGRSNTKIPEAVPGSQIPQAGFESIEADVGQTGITRNANTGSTNTKGNFRKVKCDDLGDIPLQSGGAFVFEQPGIEVPNDRDDDFIEVRSKRQLLREQRELRDKSELRDKAKSRELKVKEQFARKQQKLFGRSVLHEEASVVISGQVKHPPAVFDSNLQQFCATPTSIRTSAAAPCEPKVSRSAQSRPVAVASNTDSGRGHAFGHQYGNDDSDSTLTINAAWGVQRSSQEVVSLTQIQLEEAMKPFRFDGISSQMAPIAERGPTLLEPGISHASCSLERISAPAKTSVSVPGPISSLLAGEKIQFGAVTSPTVISSASRPHSPSFVGAIGPQFGVDMASFSSHPLSHARNYFGQDKNGAFLSSTINTRAEDDVHGQLVDPEAEAEAAASAVAVAAISNDEAVGNHSNADAALGGGAPVGTFSSFSKSSGLDGTAGAGIIQAPSKTLGVDNSIAVALPADLSVETPAPLQHVPVPSHPVSSDIMLQSLPSRASPFPCLEMGTILGGPIFAYGPREEAPLSSFEPGLAGIGAGGVAGWQHRQHANTSDSFYGAPPPFMNPAGLPSIQGHPHMLVYTNPFTPVGQFGQLGVSFMGTTYHPSGKQPDWTHTPYTTSLGSLNQSGGDVNAGIPVMMDPQHGGVASNSGQAISVAGCSMVPVPTPMSLFDPNFSSPFQAQWSRAPAPPFSNYHISGPAPGLNLQPRASIIPGELGLLSQPIHMSDIPHQLPETSISHMSGDAAAGALGVHFPDELGFGYSVISSNPGVNNVEMLSHRGHSAGRAEAVGSNMHQGQSIPQNTHGNLNLASVSSRNDPYLGTQDLRGSQLEASHAQTSELDQQRALHHHPNTLPLMDKRASQEAQARGSPVVDWAGSNQRRGGSSRPISTGSTGERGSASSSKPKQIYVAKPATPVQIMDVA